MICQRCQRVLRIGDGVKCEECDSRFHVKCINVNDSPHDLREGGDLLYQWKCAVCHKSASKSNIDTSREDFLHAISIITEKFELVNKIQLPKLNSDLIQVKSMTEHIVKQNEDILRRISDIEKKGKKSESRVTQGSSSLGYRKRSLNLTSNVKGKKNEEGDHVPILPVPEKTARYRTRRSYILRNMFHALNRKLNKNPRTPRKKI
ncbi:uncharacterized protein LOC126380018 [Pectinophora gossypiella]|uniref:uncharacterized protein LOC126380018 n=1 Tax=Pectinophora gossypiella TaxID=13191 RepID=UPI00214F3993|nr:uncharacterized protein LOC126380018 [Pectinophora gossypiella]